jgi:methyl-accepting chemotaxis protein
MEEMTATVAEISQNAQQAVLASRESAATATDGGCVVDQTVASIQRIHEATNAVSEQMDSLAHRSEEIGRAVVVIREIAEQTNLLALNAAIESARAGEHGRGFAVVAGEVKELARETARAADEISTKIETIQLDTAAAVDAIGRIGFTIVRMNEMQTTIASAVEEQTATTRSIARSVSDVSQGAAQITEHITSTADMAQSGAAGAADTQIAARELSRLASELERLVAEFNGL